MKKFVLIVFCMLFAGTAFADWNQGDPAKWVQNPLMSSYAMAVGKSMTMLADDWKCSQQGPVSDIHIWGAAEDDEYSDITDITFTLSIYSDVRPDQDITYSRPGNLLWSTTMCPTAVSLVSDNKDMGWYEPYFNQYRHAPDTSAVFDVYQYNFIIDDDPFIQEGGDIIYWLGIDAVADYSFGWMTSIEGDQVNFANNDDAVWMGPTGGLWKELRYPNGHWYGGESIDLAFVITPEPGTIALLGIGGLAVLRKRRRS